MWQNEATISESKERTSLVIDTILKNTQDGKVCQHIDMGMLQEVIPTAKVEELLEMYQMWEERERKTNMIAIVYWLIALHLYPTLSQRRVYGKMVSGLRTTRDDVPEQIPRTSAFSYRREQLGSELLQELFVSMGGPKANEEKTPQAFWKGMRLLAIDGTVESVPDTPDNREAFRYSTDDERTHSPFPQARLLLLVECGTHLICDAEISSCRQAEARGVQLLLERWRLEKNLILWDSGFHSSAAVFRVCSLGGQVLGRLQSKILLKPFCTLPDGSSLVYIYEDQDHQRGERMLVRVITYTFTDTRIPGAGELTYRLVTTLLDPVLYPIKELAVVYHERWHVEIVIDETRTHLRLAARTLRSLTPEGVIQEIYALLLAHTVIRTLMLKAAEQAHIAPTQISFTETIHVMDENLISLSLVAAPRRHHIVESVIKEIGAQRLPKQPIRIQPRVLKRAKPRYEHKKPEHASAPALEIDAEFHEIIAVVPCIQGLGSIPEMPLLTPVKETPDISTGKDRRCSGKRESPTCQSTPDLRDPIEPKTVADTSSSQGLRHREKASKAKECKSKAASLKTSRAP
jgi:Transposase DDE domain/Insertion element 4 transposase N-terminal